ncbi:MAG: hypothetical protein WDM88_05820 [Galbitalea sp.]
MSFPVRFCPALPRLASGRRWAAGLMVAGVVALGGMLGVAAPPTPQPRPSRRR